MRIELKVEGKTPQEIARYIEILGVMLEKGALDGVKGGSTVLHFDKDGVFQQLQLDYSPWKRRRTTV